MCDLIRLQMMGNFTIYVNEQQADYMVNKSRKGLALMQYLIMNHGARVSNRRLIMAFWPDEDVVNPESALKTLISRLRTLLNQVSKGLGSCIASDRGAYYFRCLSGMVVDVYELEKLFKRITQEKDNDEALVPLYEKMMDLYRGDLLKDSEMNEWSFPQAATMHNEYTKSVYDYIELLKKKGSDKQTVVVCRRALEIDPFDDHIHIELMGALLRCNAINEAKAQYDEAIHLHYHYLNVEPSKELKEFYNQIVDASKTIEFSLQSVCRELQECDNDHNAFVCDYLVFKKIYSIQVHNIERLGSTMFLAVVMISKLDGEPMSSLKQNNVMRDLLEIMNTNLRKGDIITHFAPTVIAMLLPTVNYITGDAVLERLKQKFYQKYPNSNILFNYRIAPLTGENIAEGGRKA